MSTKLVDITNSPLKTNPKKKLLFNTTAKTTAYDDAKKVKKKSNADRLLVLQELCDSERRYVTRLEVAIDSYMIPLKSQVHPQTMSQIFGNIEDLLNCNRRFLADLDRLRPKTYKDFNVGKTLSLYSHFFRVYKQYCNNYGDAMVVLGKLCSKDSQFEKFLNRAEQTSNHKLVDILITPIQRLVRLKLLLERIIKFTDDSHEDFSDLKCALVGISEVADYVNKGISQKEARLRVWEVQRMLVRFLVFFVPPPYFSIYCLPTLLIHTHIYI